MVWNENITGYSMFQQNCKRKTRGRKTAHFPKLKKCQESRYVCMSKDITREAEIMILEMVRVYMGHCKAKSTSC